MTEIAPGLCSVTFRDLDPEAVIDIAAGAALTGIEWGADVHLPPGDLARAGQLRERCADHALTCPSYGSYYYPGRSDAAELAPTLATAGALGASTVRVWAAGDPRPNHWDRNKAVIDALAETCDRAAELGLDIAMEFHPGTLTETARSTREVLAEVDRANLRTYWQPTPGATHLHALTELDPVLHDVRHLHVFSWEADRARLPLAAHETLWRKAFEKIAARPDGQLVYAYLEFVENDAPEALARDAKTLHALLGALP
jgi:3-dehydroshikimate dehydratase